MSTDELSPPTSCPLEPGTGSRPPWCRRPWFVPPTLVTVAFVAFAVPPYLTLDPAQARLQPMPTFPGYYPLLVPHILLGSLVLLTACLQVWPWLRQNHATVHRTSGRIYVAAALPAAVCVMIIAPMTLHGANARVANTILAVLWFGTTAAGFRAVPAAPLRRPPAMDAAQRRAQLSIVANRCGC